MVIRAVAGNGFGFHHSAHASLFDIDYFAAPEGHSGFCIVEILYGFVEADRRIDLFLQE